jgi:hypothetical protein
LTFGSGGLNMETEARRSLLPSLELRFPESAGWRFLVATVGVLAVGAFVYFAPGNEFQRAFCKLKLGMTKSETDAVFGKIPEYECRFRSYRVRYYRRPLIYGHRPKRVEGDNLPPRDVANTISEIPYIYASAQLLFDAEDRLVAFTQNGETDTIETSHGRLIGDRLDRLDNFP